MLPAEVEIFDGRKQQDLPWLPKENDASNIPTNVTGRFMMVMIVAVDRSRGCDHM